MHLGCIIESCMSSNGKSLIKLVNCKAMNAKCVAAAFLATLSAAGAKTFVTEARKKRQRL